MLLKNKYIFFGFLLLLVMSVCLYAETYYVNARTGDDSNNGLAVSNAWKTLTKVEQSDFQSGDSLLFNRGNTWVGKLYFPSSGTRALAIYIGAYGSGERPEITSIDTIPKWNIVENWTEVSNNVWALYCDFNPKRLLKNGEEILHIYPPILIDEDNPWSYKNDSLYLYSTENPAISCSLLQGNMYYYNLLFRSRSHVIVDALEFSGGSGNCVTIQGADDIEIRNCSIGKYSWIGVRVQDYAGLSSNDIRIKDNRIDSGFNFSYRAPEKRNVEDGVLFSAGVENSVVQGNEILDWAHCGVYLYALYDGDPGVRNNIVCDNVISGENISYMHGIGCDGRESLCEYNEFCRNLILHTTVRNQINGNNNCIHHNIIFDTKNSPVKGGATAQGFDLQCYGSDKVCHDNRIENNTIMYCEEAGIYFRADINDKKNNIIANNLIYNCAYNSKAGLDHYGIYVQNHTSIFSNIFKNNCIYSEHSPYLIYYRGRKLTVEQFNFKNGENTDSMSNNIMADPIVNIVLGDELATLNKSSACIDAGCDVDYFNDFSNLIAPVGAAWDIGALEYRSDLNISDIHCKDFRISNLYPNPFNPSLTLEFLLKLGANIQIELVDLDGRIIDIITNSYFSAGKHSLKWSPKNISTGIYILKISANDIISTRKIAYLK